MIIRLFSSRFLAGTGITVGLALIASCLVGCSENVNRRAKDDRSDIMPSADTIAAEFDGWNEDNTINFEDALNLVSPDNRVCTQKIVKDYELLIAVRLIGGPRNGQRVFGGVRMPELKRSGSDTLEVNPADTILCYDGKEWQFNTRSVIDFKNLDLPIFIGMGGDQDRTFGINSGYDQNAFEDLGKKFRMLGKNHFSFVDRRTRVKGMGKVDFRLRVLPRAPDSPERPSPLPCGPSSPLSPSNCLPLPAPAPIPPPNPSPIDFEEGPKCPATSSNSGACPPIEPPRIPTPEWVSDWLSLVAEEDRPCMAKIVDKRYPLMFRVQVVSGSRSSKIFVGGMISKRPELADKSFVTVNVNDTIFCYSGQEWPLGPGAQLEFNGSNLVRLITEGGDQQHRFGFNSGFDRYQFWREEESFIRSGDDYFGYLDASTIVDGAGRIEYRWIDNRPPAILPVLPVPLPGIAPPQPQLPPEYLPSPPPMPDMEMARRCLMKIQQVLDGRYFVLGWDGPATLNFIQSDPSCRMLQWPMICSALRLANSCYGTRDGTCANCGEVMESGKFINPARIIQCSPEFQRCLSN